MSSQDTSSQGTVGRPRGFDPAVALAAALDVLWRQGYEATSLDDLTVAMGVSRSSFYACFGSKHGVMMAAVRSYTEAHFARLTALAGQAAPKGAVRAMLAAIADAEGGTRGCFFANAVTELAPHDPALAALAQGYIARLATLLADTIARLGCPSDVAADRAGALLAIAVGATTLRKAGLPAAYISHLLAQADHLLPPHET